MILIILILVSRTKSEGLYQQTLHDLCRYIPICPPTKPTTKAKSAPHPNKTRIPQIVYLNLASPSKTISPFSAFLLQRVKYSVFVTQIQIISSCTVIAAYMPGR
jgi:hypothetical protein